MPFGASLFIFHLFYMLDDKKNVFYLVDSFKSRTFAVLLARDYLLAIGNRDVVQLVVYLVWDQVVARSSRVIPTRKKEDVWSPFFVLFLFFRGTLILFN